MASFHGEEGENERLNEPTTLRELNILEECRWVLLFQAERIGEVVGEIANMARQYIYRNNAGEEEHRRPNDPQWNCSPKACACIQELFLG